MKKSLLVMVVLAMVLGLMAVACGNDDEGDALGTEGAACRAADDELGECDEGLVCVEAVCVLDDETPEDGDTPDGDTPDGDEEPACVDDDCPGAALCNETDECEVLCVGTKFNESCPGATEFTTLAFGECAEVPCESHADCNDLGNCDDPAKTSTKVFVCNADFLCVRNK